MHEAESTIITMPVYAIYLTHILPIVISVIVCIWVWYAFRKNNRSISKILEAQTKRLDQFKSELTNNSAMFATNLISAVKNNGGNIYVDSEPSYGTLFEIFHKIKQITSSDLYENMVNTKACRIAIYLFHNGTKTPSGLNFLKISCIGEKVLVGSGIKERALKHSGLTVNIFDDMYSQLLESGRVLLMSSDGTVMNSNKAEFISAPKIQYSQVIAIYDTDNNVIGFILAEFEHMYNKTTADVEYTELVNLSKKLTPIFSFTEYVNLTTGQNQTNITKD